MHTQKLTEKLQNVINRDKISFKKQLRNRVA